MKCGYGHEHEHEHGNLSKRAAQDTLLRYGRYGTLRLTFARMWAFSQTWSDPTCWCLETRIFADPDGSGTASLVLCRQEIENGSA
jgi:hypothetical protein